MAPILSWAEDVRAVPVLTGSYRRTDREAQNYVLYTPVTTVMRHPVLSLRRAFWMVCACLLLLLPQAAAASPSVSIDLDGDGYHDRVMLDGREPFVLHIWLSASGRTQIIHSRVALLQ